MKKKVIVLYDDTLRPDERIGGVSGKSSFGGIIFRQSSMRDRMERAVLSGDAARKFISFDSGEEKSRVLDGLARGAPETGFVYIYSAFAVKDGHAFDILLQKAAFLNRTFRVETDGHVAGWMFSSAAELGAFADGDACAAAEVLDGGMLADLSDYDTFIKYITSGFDARFFNRLQGSEYTVTKHSSDKEKIRNEHDFYYFLPRQMQHWFVQPYGFEETKDGASYTMERMSMADLALRYVNGAIDGREMDQIFRQLFYFLETRCARDVSPEEYRLAASKVYVDKVKSRLDAFKKSGWFTKMDAMVALGTDYDGIDGVFEKYFELYGRAARRDSFKHVSVISHGDLCFSNILYQKNANVLRIIDPKGAACEGDMWMDPLYDVAKLSHSVCGRYDFFNCGLFTIESSEDLRWRLHIDFDNSVYVSLFRKYVENAGYDWYVVRLYEASLFLSMLPLHIDNRRKVFGFLLNAIDILGEVEGHV